MTGTFRIVTENNVFATGKKDFLKNKLEWIHKMEGAAEKFTITLNEYLCNPANSIFKIPFF